MADQNWFDRQKAEMEAIERARAIIQRHASYTSHNNPELAWAADLILRYFDAGRAELKQWQRDLVQAEIETRKNRAKPADVS